MRPVPSRPVPQTWGSATETDPDPTDRALAVPLARVDETARVDIYVRGETLGGVLTSAYQLESFAMLAGTFVVVYLVWVRHGRQFHRLAREDAGSGLVLSNALELLLTSMLPVTAATAARSSASVAGYSDADADAAARDKRRLALPFCANVLGLATARVTFEAFALLSLIHI